MLIWGTIQALRILKTVIIVCKTIQVRRINNFCIFSFEVDQKIAKNDEKYFFDHGNVDYFHTTDCPPHLVSEMIARQTSIHATKFWAEIFGTINIGVMFIVSFILQLYK